MSRVSSTRELNT